MSKATDDLLETFLRLTPDERGRFLVEAQAMLLEVEPDVLAEQEAEALRRSESIRRGEVQTIPHDDVMQALRG